MLFVMLFLSHPKTATNKSKITSYWAVMGSPMLHLQSSIYDAFHLPFRFIEKEGARPQCLLSPEV